MLPRYIVEAPVELLVETRQKSLGDLARQRVIFAEDARRVFVETSVHCDRLNQVAAVILSAKKMHFVNGLRGLKSEADCSRVYAGSLPWWRTGLVAPPSMTFLLLLPAHLSFVSFEVPRRRTKARARGWTLRAGGSRPGRARAETEQQLVANTKQLPKSRFVFISTLISDNGC